MARIKYFITTFGLNGDTTAVPDAAQPSGSVSFNDGYGSKYSEDPTGTGLFVEREENNFLFAALTSGVQEFQQRGIPEMITTVENGGVPFPYSINTLIRDSDKVYRSLINTNTDATTVETSWREEFLQADFDETNVNSSAFILNKPPTGPATTTTPGVVQLATPFEADEGINNNKATTPLAVEETRKRARTYTVVAGTAVTVNGTSSGAIIETTSGSAITVDVELSGPNPFTQGDILTFVQSGGGQMSIVAGAGISIDVPSALTIRTREQHSAVSLIFKTATNAVLSGDLEQA